MLQGNGLDKLMSKSCYFLPPIKKSSRARIMTDGRGVVKGCGVSLDGAMPWFKDMEAEGRSNKFANGRCAQVDEQPRVTRSKKVLRSCD